MFSKGFAHSVFMSESTTPGRVADFIRNLGKGEVLLFLNDLNAGLDTYFFRHSRSEEVRKEFVSAVDREIEHFEKNNQRANLDFLKKGLGNFFEKQEKLLDETRKNKSNGIRPEQAIQHSLVAYLQKRADRAILCCKLRTPAFSKIGSRTLPEVKALKRALA